MDTTDDIEMMYSNSTNATGVDFSDTTADLAGVMSNTDAWGDALSDEAAKFADMDFMDTVKAADNGASPSDATGADGFVSPSTNATGTETDFVDALTAAYDAGVMTDYLPYAFDSDKASVSSNTTASSQFGPDFGRQGDQGAGSTENSHGVAITPRSLHSQRAPLENVACRSISSASCNSSHSSKLLVPLASRVSSALQLTTSSPALQRPSVPVGLGTARRAGRRPSAPVVSVANTQFPELDSLWSVCEDGLNKQLNYASDEKEIVSMLRFENQHLLYYTVSTTAKSVCETKTNTLVGPSLER